MTLLTVDSVTKRYGGLVAVDECSFEIGSDSLVGLIGPNGAGKTTLFNIITGLEDVDGGTIEIGGTRIENERPSMINREGIARSFQTTREWSRMTVMENLLLASPDQPGESPVLGVLNTPSVRETEAEKVEEASEVLQLVELYEKRNQLASSLSVGQRKLLEIGRCLMTDPDLLLLDEPFAGVAPALVPVISEHLASLQGEDLSILVIEHNIDELSNLVEEILVMNNGQIMTRGAPGDVRRDREVQEAYLGGQ
jgi:ABC-type branched-subunit amino acid transport system ATPase component